MAERHGGVKTRSRAGKMRKQSLAFLPDKATLVGAQAKLTDKETESLERYETATIRKLTMYLRTVLNTLERDRKFKEFVELPSKAELPLYYKVISEPVSLEIMQDANDSGKYGKRD